jgi:O-antigen/teichoic acid export membrane protein
LFAVQLLVELVVCVLALSAFARYFSLRSVLASVRSWQWDRALLAFAIPQSFNLTFNRYITRIDSIMLASFGLAQVDLAYFGTAAYLTSNIGQIRGIFSGALGPVLARLHVRGERAAFEAELSRVCRWTTSLAVPLVLVLVIVRTDVMRLVSESYVGNSLFIVVLLIPPLTNCAYGMAGACLMFTGHSKVILTNSLCVALLNTGLTYLLIPRYGMLGAAVATAVATSITTGLQVFELWRLEGLRIRASAVWKPHVGFALGALLLALLWDPSALGLSARITVACAMGIGFLLLMLALRLEELRPLAARARRELPGA